MDMNSYLHVLNPNRKNRRGVARFFNKNKKLKSIWVDRTSHPTHLETIVDWALVEGWSQIAVWGGDGTLSRVLQCLYEKKKLDSVPLRLVPVGTGNDFARKLKLPHWSKYVYKNGNSKQHQFDLGLVQFNGLKKIFVNNSGFGRSKEALSRVRPKPLKDIQEFRKKRLQIEWKTPKVKQVETLWAFFGIVFNAPFFNKGMYFDKNIEPDDGLLNAFIVPPQKGSHMLFKFLKSKLGASLKGPRDIRIDAEFISVESDEILYPQADGEVLAKEGTHQLHYSLIPRGFVLEVPI